MGQYMYEISSFEKILLSKKIRYEVLNKIFDPIMPDQEEAGNTVNLFVDIYSIYNQIFNPENIDEFSSMNVKERNKFAAHVLNICGHYRNYFAKFHQRYTNIFVYYPSEKCEDKQKIDSAFKNQWYSKRLDFNDPIFGRLSLLLKKNLDVAQMISVYIPHLYLIDTKDVDHLVVPSLLIKNMKAEKCLNVIVSNNKLAYEDISKYEFTIGLQTRGDQSKIIDESNLLEEFTSSTKIDSSHRTIFKFFYQHIISIAGCKDFGIKGVPGYTVLKGINLFKDLIDKQKLTYVRYDDIEAMSKLFREERKMNEIDLMKYETNFVLLTSGYLDKINKGKITIISNQIQDKKDFKSLEALNAESFVREPLRLEMLFKGELDDEN